MAYQPNWEVPPDQGWPTTQLPPSDEKLLDAVANMFGEISGRLHELNRDAAHLADRVFGAEPEQSPPSQVPSKLEPPASQRIRNLYIEVSDALMRAEYLAQRLRQIA